MLRQVIKQHLLTLLDDYRDLNSSSTTVQSIPSAVEFSKQVSRGYPCVYKAYKTIKDDDGNALVSTDSSLLESPAFTWTKQDLVNLVEDKVEVAVTPDGRADDLASINGHEGPVFLAPATLEMTIAELLNCLESSTPNPSDFMSRTPAVYYLQSQNSNLTTTPLASVLKHVPRNFPFAEPVLSDPEAINIWIGDSRSVTSTHRDPYENLYLVLKGSKTFTLYPPVDEITLPTVSVRTGKYNFDKSTSSFSTSLDESETPDDPPTRIPWIALDPSRLREQLIAEHPMYEHSSPRVVTVREGEILYLPSGWYHHVRQECGTWHEDGSPAPCIAVNYWYDMEYDGEKYVMRQLIGRLVQEMREEDGLNATQVVETNMSRTE
ncbi:hypothetical protein H2198_002338 [Neophaeococcomyces mojaviensis]|uniref:Uncharacterized protein n=1 Tax=Neophaeococcomyces mojaviensis TaxID=3383035 RepID=A0ACC3AEJ6_9EURO|nr:hypothetical protein H2198_002338 [Knufia sp. JES_112]